MFKDFFQRSSDMKQLTRAKYLKWLRKNSSKISLRTMKADTVNLLFDGVIDAGFHSSSCTTDYSSRV